MFSHDQPAFVRASVVSAGRRFAFLIVFAAMLLSVAPMASLGQRAITNPSIELPAFINNQVYFYEEGSVPGWLTSHPFMTASCGNGPAPNTIDCRPFERWSSGFSATLPATGAGSRWVELNAYQASMIYQQACLANGESFDYSFVHRGRSSATIADVVQYRIGIPAGLPVGSKTADSYSLPILQASTTNNGTVTTPPSGSGTINTPVSGGNGWVRYSGTYTYTGTTQVVNMGFAAVSSAGGIASGNFIDDWQIQLAPYIELGNIANAGTEGSAGDGGSISPTNRPGIRIGGQVDSDITVTFNVSGGTATVGNDYSLTVPFEAANVTTVATVNIPAGNYDGVSADSIFLIPFSVNTDSQVEVDETVTFSLVSAPGAAISSISSCGGAAETTAAYTIQNDDVLTSANVSISGRTVTPDGRGLYNAYAILTDAEGNSRSARTSSFGYFRFDGVPAGQMYILSVGSKRYTFDPIAVAVKDDIDGLVLTAIR